MSIKDGGPAFPYVVTFKDGTDVRYEEGLSLRDYFAGKAMEGIISSAHLKSNTFQVVAKDAYAQADAMLKAREE